MLGEVARESPNGTDYATQTSWDCGNDFRHANFEIEKGIRSELCSILSGGANREEYWGKHRHNHLGTGVEMGLEQSTIRS